MLAVDLILRLGFALAFFLHKILKNYQISDMNLNINSHQLINQSPQQQHRETHKKMLNEESTTFPKQIKIDDYEPYSQKNLIRIMQTSNLLLGNGGRSTNTSVIIAKCLHMLIEENSIELRGKTVLEFGCGVGLLSIYMAALGVNVVLSDLPQMKDMAERNINLNREVLKGEAEFVVLNWKKQKKIEEMSQKQRQQGKSTSSSDISNLKSIDKIDWTLACQSGNLEDFQLQIQWIGKQGMIVGFLERQGYKSEEFLTSRQLEQFLLGKEFEYERIQSYHPDYVDQRVAIYKIWK